MAPASRSSGGLAGLRSRPARGDPVLARFRRRDRRRSEVCGASSISRRSASTAIMAAPGSTRRAQTDAAIRTRPRPARRRGAMERARRFDGRPRAYSAPGRHLRPGPQSSDQAARRRCAAHRQARPDLQPRPCRGYRPGDQPDARRRAGRAASGTSRTKSRRRRRTSSPSPRNCLASPPPPEEPFETADMTPMARSFYADNKRVSIAKLKTRAWLCAEISDLSRGPAGARGGG